MKATRLLMLLAAATGALAQVSFEVASVKPAAPGSTMVSVSTDQSQLRYSNVTIKDLVINAYKVRDYQISGLDSIDTARFDVLAKLPSGAAKEQAPLMLQGLLAERFGMTFHREKREMQAYALVVGRDGSKLQASTEAGRVSMGMGHVEAQGITVANLADILARIVNRPVSDMTAIAGPVRFTLDWAPESSPQDELGLDTTGRATIFTAVQEQLGLKLESRKQLIEFLVIDHVEKTPTQD
jgi:uncharacterized protein (TIGR03435 family)